MAKIMVKTVVEQDIEKVWEAWTGLEHISGWAFASDDWAATPEKNDLKEGGEFKTRMFAKDGSFGFDFEGVYTKIDIGKEIAYDLADGRHVEITFEETPEGVLITQTFDAETQNSEEMQREGWQAFMNNFKKYAEGM